MTFEMIFLTRCQGKPLMYNLNKKQDDSGNAVDIDVKEGEYMRNGDVTLT